MRAAPWCRGTHQVGRGSGLTSTALPASFVRQGLADQVPHDGLIRSKEINIIHETPRSNWVENLLDWRGTPGPEGQSRETDVPCLVQKIAAFEFWVSFNRGKVDNVPDYQIRAHAAVWFLSQPILKPPDEASGTGLAGSYPGGCSLGEEEGTMWTLE